jgi:hypothetical protein
MLILLAALRIPALKERMGAEIMGLGSDLGRLIECWSWVPGEGERKRSPSVQQSLRMIREVEGFIAALYQRQSPAMMRGELALRADLDDSMGYDNENPQ